MSRVPPRGALPVEVETEGPAAGGRRAQQIESLLSDLGSRIRRGGGGREAGGRLPVGRAAIDRLLGGGFLVGALNEVSGAASSGRTSLALGLLATTTARGELAAWVDGADAFDPASAERLGVDLERVLWVRAAGWREALGASERLVQTEGFPLVLLDGTAPLRGGSEQSAPPPSAWLRLTRLVAASHTALLLLSRERLAGSHAALAVEMQPARPRFSGVPVLLDALEARMTVVRSRAAAVDPQASHPVPSVLPVSRARSTPPHESAA